MPPVHQNGSGRGRTVKIFPQTMTLPGSANYLKGTILQFIYFLKGGHHDAIDLWSNNYILKYIFWNQENFISWFIFALKSMVLPCKIMEQCRLCPAKSWSNADFAPRDQRAFILCPAKSQRLCSLPRKIMEQCRLCSAKSWQHSFRGKVPKLPFSC